MSASIAEAEAKFWKLGWEDYGTNKFLLLCACW